MSSQSLEDLAEQRRILDAALAENKHERKKLMQQQKDKAKREKAMWKISEFLWHTVLIIYVLSDYTLEPARRYLHNSSRQRHWPEKTEEELTMMIEDKYLQVDLDDLAALTQVDEPADARAMRAAIAFLEQWKLVGWAKTLNEKGVAPSTDAVLQRLEQSRASLPEPVRPPLRGSVADPKARKYVKAWRKRWGGKYSQVPVREVLPAAEMREKVFVR